jgi:KUP system potassium uptake protein
VFLTAEMGTVPNALLHNLKHNKVLHAHNLFVTVRNHEVPWIGHGQAAGDGDAGHDCWQVVIHYGFKNDPDVPKALELDQTPRRACWTAMTTSYFLSRDTVMPTLGGGMALWREKTARCVLFAQMHRNASGLEEAADFLNIPSNAVVDIVRAPCRPAIWGAQSMRKDRARA